MKRMVQKWLFAAVAALMAMGLSTASADEVYVEAFGSSLFTSDVERTMATTPGVGGSGIVLGYEPEAFAGARVMVGYDGAGYTNRFLFDGDVEGRWARNRVMAMGDWGYDLVGPWLRPMVRLGVGYSHQRLDLSTSDADYRGTDHGISALVAGGLEASFGRDGDIGEELMSWDRFSLGLNVLLGYAWQSRADFDSMETTEEIDEDDDPWQRGSYDAGSLDMSGMTFSMGLMLRYRFGQ